MGSRILLADDSITIQKVVNLTFQDEGIEVVSVSNGDMAERRLKEVNPDLVLADIFMPGKNGYELCESIKQDPDLSTVPVILLVGAFEPFNEAEARRVQADAHLTKPFESRVLVETVRTLMDKYPKPQPAPPAPQPLPEPVATFPTTQAIVNPPFNLDTPLMGEPFPATFSNQEFPPLHLQPSQQEAAFTDPTPLTPAVEAPPFANAFPSRFGTDSLQETTFTIEQPVQPQVRVPASTPSVDLEQTADFSTTSNQASGTYEETPLQLDDSVNLNPELVNFYEQYDKSPSHQEMTQALGSYTPQSDPGQQTAFDLVVDFDKVESPEVTSDSVLGVDVDAFADSVHEGQTVANRGELFTDSAARKFDTNELESKSEGGANTQVNLNTAPMNNLAVQVQNDLPSPTLSALPETESHSEILAADEPLGDLLTNLQPLAEPLEATSAQSPLELDEPYFAGAQAQATVTPEPDSLPAGTAAMPLAESPLTGVSTTHPETSSQILEMPAEETPLQEEATFQIVTQPAMAEAPAFNEFASNEFASNEFVSSNLDVAPATFSPAEVSFSETQRVESLPAAPVAEPLAQAVVEPMAEPLRAATPSPYNGLDKGHSEALNLLTDFTPVNLEAAVPQAASSDNTTQERVAEIPAPLTPASQALGEEQASVLELPSSPQPEALNHQGGDMSQEMIDEIVRRVVAQLSDRVVREIAWEVVPDCVERVVNNLTREGMNNKLAN
jgi:CheY-like chemotaxis protein